MPAGTTYDDNAFYFFATTLLFFFVAPSAYYVLSTIAAFKPAPEHKRQKALEVRAAAAARGCARALPAPCPR